MIHIFVGEESLLLGQDLDRLLSERLGDGLRDFNCDILDGGAIDPRQVLSQAATLPVMSARRIVLIRNAQEIKKAALDVLEPLLKTLPETTDLIFTASKVDGRLGFWKAAREAGRWREFKTPTASEAARWLSEEAGREGCPIDSEAAYWMVGAVGCGLSSLRMALRKLILLNGGEKRIRLADAEAGVAHVSWKNVFELTEAVGRRDLGSALKLFRKMFDAGESPVALLALIARHFRILSRVREGDTAGIPPFFLKDYQNQAARFQAGELEKKRERLFETDWKLKGSPIPAERIFERLMIDLCGISPGGRQARSAG